MISPISSSSINQAGLFAIGLEQIEYQLRTPFYELKVIREPCISLAINQKAIVIIVDPIGIAAFLAKYFLTL